ncbi:unnamed protein product, partial [Adineta ricciae]
FHDLNGAIGLSTIERWCKVTRESGSINLSKSPGRPRIIRTKAAIQKLKKRLSRRNVSARKLSRDLVISQTSFRRVLKDDLQLRAYKVQTEPLLTDEHKAVNRTDAYIRGGIRQKRKFPQKLMVWLGVCSKGVSPLVIFEKGTVDHDRYIKEVLPIALKYGNKVFGNDWVFQQDGAKPHTHGKTQDWCAENFPSFIDKDHWPPDSPDLNPLDYCIWNDFAQSMNWDKVT